MTKTDRLYYVIFRNTVDDVLENVNNDADCVPMDCHDQEKCHETEAVGDSVKTSVRDYVNYDKVEYDYQGKC